MGEWEDVVKRRALAKVLPMSHPACNSIACSVSLVWGWKVASAKLQRMSVLSVWSGKAWRVTVEEASSLR